MNKSSVKKKRPAKASRSSAVRKSPNRTAAARKTASKSASSKTASRQQVRKPQASIGAAKSIAIGLVRSVTGPKSLNGAKSLAGHKALTGHKTLNGAKSLNGSKTLNGSKPAAAPAATVTVAQVTALSTPLQTHRFQVGQTVFYTSSPISRPGATGTYEVVRLLPSDGDDYQYRIKNPGEAFERVAKESQLELEH